MALLSLPESGYASIPFFAVANDTIRRAVIYFDANEAKVDLSYKDNNQAITILDSLLLGNLNTKYITALNVETFVSPDGDESYNRSLAWENPIGGSDNGSFAKVGIPIIWYHTDGHPDYHQPSDHADRLNWDKVVEITKASFLNMWKMANEKSF